MRRSITLPALILIAACTALVVTGCGSKSSDGRNASKPRSAADKGITKVSDTDRNRIATAHENALQGMAALNTCANARKVCTKKDLVKAWRGLGPALAKPPGTPGMAQFESKPDGHFAITTYAETLDTNRDVSFQATGRPVDGAIAVERACQPAVILEFCNKDGSW